MKNIKSLGDEIDKIIGKNINKKIKLSNIVIKDIIAY